MIMATSQNGWPASANRAEIHVQPFWVNSVAFPGGVAAGAVATLLAYVAAEFNARVEPLIEGSCWGYAYRDVRDGADLSNHASGTAIDINAPKHPLGQTGTFTAGQKRSIRAILKDIGGVVRWGGDYSGRKDEMHFEINADRAAVDLAAANLINKGDEDMSALTDTIVDAGYRLWDWLNGNEKQTGGPNKGKALPAVVDQNALKWRVEALVKGRTEVSEGPTKGEPVETVRALYAVRDQLAKVTEALEVLAQERAAK
jgi:hypothetical protein